MRLSFASVLVVAALAASPVSGQAVYTYQGGLFSAVSPPYTAAMSVSGSFEVAAPLPPSTANIDLSGGLTAFSFFDGIEARDETNSLICQFQVSTDAGGAIVAWDVWLREAGGADPQHSLETHTAVDLAGELSPNVGCGAGALNPFASLTGSPGAWTSQTTSVVEVPTLSAVGLAAFGACVVGFALWTLRRRRVATL